MHNYPIIKYLLVVFYYSTLFVIDHTQSIHEDDIQTAQNRTKKFTFFSQPDVNCNKVWMHHTPIKHVD